MEVVSLLLFPLSKEQYLRFAGDLIHIFQLILAISSNLVPFFIAMHNEHDIKVTFSITLLSAHSYLKGIQKLLRKASFDI